MNTYNNYNHKKYINADNIYPKRIGLYQNGNALVLQYYNLQIDKFKKHIIQLDRTKSIKQNIDQIYKNQKHSLLLRKVQRQYIQSTIKGENVNYGQQFKNSTGQRYEYNQNQYHYQQQGQYSNILNSLNINSYTNYYNYSNSNQNNNNNNSHNSNINKNSYSQTIQNDISAINEKSSIIQKNQKIKHQINQIEEYYQEQFQDFQVSQSLGKKNNIQNQNNNKNKQKINNKQQKFIEDDSSPIIQKKIKKSKSKKKKKEQKQLQDQFQFDFLDQNGKQNKKNKKDKSKSKDKKEKSKDKDKQKQKQKKIVKQEKNKPVVETNIEEEFQFL